MSGRTTEVFYAVDGDDDDRISFVTELAVDFGSELDQEHLAHDAAGDYWNNHDGWEAHWPVTIALYGDEDGGAIASFCVDMELTPEFIVRRLAEGAPQ